MLSSVVLLLVGLLVPGLSLPFPPDLQDTAFKNDESVAPEVHLLHSSHKPPTSSDTVMLTCSASGINSEDMDITWQKDGKPKPLSPNTERHWKDANGQTFSTTSTVYLSFNEFLLQVSFSCQLTHAPTRANMESQARKRTGDSNLEPANFTCVMNKEKLAASWSQENPGTLTPKTLEVQTESNGTISQATASIRNWENGETFTCKVEHTKELAHPEGEKTG